jgi:type III pantothenate kinase
MPFRRALPTAFSEPRLVVDVGNTRIKWGLCDATSVAKSASLPPDEPAAWQKQLKAWRLKGLLAWAVSGVHPQRRDRLADWLRDRGDSLVVIDSPKQLPLRVALQHPGRVGIDRLLDAVAVNKRRPPNTPAIIIDAGSAVTVDYVDQRGVFRGGTILPGLRLMAAALHDYTALLPLVEVDTAVKVPATSTVEAVKAGTYYAVLGGIRMVIESLIEGQLKDRPFRMFLSGGDAPLLHRHILSSAVVWPSMTLEGLRAVAWPAENE